jgi:hypothetical protein
LISIRNPKSEICNLFRLLFLPPCGKQASPLSPQRERVRVRGVVLILKTTGRRFGSKKNSKNPVTLQHFVKSPLWKTGQGCWKSFRTDTFYWIIQIAPKVLQRLVHFLHFNTVKYKCPHSKTLEASLTGGLIPFNFKELKCYKA